MRCSHMVLFATDVHLWPRHEGWRWLTALFHGAAFNSYVAGYYSGSSHPSFLYEILEQHRKSTGYDTYPLRVTSETLFQIIGSTAMMCLGPSRRSGATRCLGMAGSWESTACRHTPKWKPWVGAPSWPLSPWRSIGTTAGVFVLRQRSCKIVPKAARKNWRRGRHPAYTVFCWASLHAKFHRTWEEGKIPVGRSSKENLIRTSNKNLTRH